MNEKSYFGMTKMQLGILGGLAGFLLLIVCIAGSMILRNPGFLGPDPIPPTVPPTVTSSIIDLPTLTPTITPTPVPYEQLIPENWKQYRTSLVEIWLPDNFKASTKKTNESITEFGFVEMVINEIPSKSSAYTMTVGISYEPLVGDSLDSFLDANFPSIPYQGRVTDRRTVYINTIEARRLVIEMKINNVDFNDMIYVIQDGGTVWYVQYVAEISEYFQNLSVFEQSIKTFRVAK